MNSFDEAMETDNRSQDQRARETQYLDSNEKNLRSREAEYATSDQPWRKLQMHVGRYTSLHEKVEFTYLGRTLTTNVNQARRSLMKD